MRILYFVSVVSSSSSSFFARLFSAAADWMSPILPHMMWPQCEFRMQVWNVLNAARWIYRTQKLHKKLPYAHHRTNSSGYISSQLRHILIIGKHLLNSRISSTCSHNMVNVGPLAAEISSRVWGTPAHFNRFHVLALLLQRRHSPEANQTLHDLCPCPGLLHYIHFRGLLPPNGIFQVHNLCPHLVLSYIGSVTAWHSSSGHQPNFAAWYKECNYGMVTEGATYIRLAAITLGIGPHSSFDKIMHFACVHICFYALRLYGKRSRLTEKQCRDLREQ